MTPPNDPTASAYTRELYQTVVAPTARSSAEVIVPLVLKHLRLRSVVDFGCGTGEWLAVFREHGVEEVLGIDGPRVERDLLSIAPEEFHEHDLREPFVSTRKFDLALCLEVVEHISPQGEATFLDSLASLAPVILFSAPIPRQVGVGDGDHNNRWPAYRASLLAERGFLSVDFLRAVVWEDARVAWWYAQNIWLAAREEMLAGIPSLRGLREAGPDTPLPLVHPGLLDEIVGNTGARPTRAPAGRMRRALEGLWNK